MIGSESKDRSFPCSWNHPLSRHFLGIFFCHRLHPGFVSYPLHTVLKCGFLLSIRHLLVLRLTPGHPWLTPEVQLSQTVVYRAWHYGHFHHLLWISAAIDRPLRVSQSRFALFSEVVQTSIIPTWRAAEGSSSRQQLSFLQSPHQGQSQHRFLIWPHGIIIPGVLVKTPYD